MENENLAREEVIAKGEQLRAKIDRAMFEHNSQEAFGDNLMTLHEIKYLGKFEFTVEGKEELVEKDVFMTIEEIDGQFQYKYYDENMQFIGMQDARNMNIISFNEHLPENSIMKLENLDKTSLKTIDELKEEQEQNKQKEQQEQQEENKNKPEQNNQEISQLTKAQVNSLNGPKTRLAQVVDGVTLGNAIGLSGEYIKLVDADKIKKLFPDMDIPTGQRYIPIEIFTDGTANVVGEDKLSLSHIEGTNSMKEQVTVTNEGAVTNEQNIETFNIAAKGNMHTISIGYDENGANPKEIKYGRRDITEPTQIAYSELETVHEDRVQDSDARIYRKETGDGIYKSTETKQRAEAHEDCGEELQAEDVDANPNNNNIHEEDVEKYAKAMNIRKIDESGYPTAEYDLEMARNELEKRLSEEQDMSVDEIIEENQKTMGPAESPRPH